MSGTEQDIERARQKAVRARARLADTLSEIQDRFHPRTLINDAWQEVRERGGELADQAVNAARARPAAMSAAAAAAVALFAREPIWRALTALISRRRDKPEAVEEEEGPSEVPHPPVGGEIPISYEEVA